MTRSFSSYFAQSEEQSVKALLQELDWKPDMSAATEQRARVMVEALRAENRGAGQLEAFMRDYSLDTQEGLALMSLAEALLRIPDAQTANALIKDKVLAANWLDSVGGSQDWVVKAAGVGLFMSGKAIDSLVARVGEPFIRGAMVKAMQVLGKQFVLGQSIEDAMKNARSFEEKSFRMSYDILGEGARTEEDAQRYFEAYGSAIEALGKDVEKNTPKNKDTKRPGISVKLSALHSRYEYAQVEMCVPEMIVRVSELAKKAAKYDLAFTIDAEESERLNLSLRIFEGVLRESFLEGWDGFGLAVQAYHKAAPEVIDYIVDLARESDRRVQLRLVKGAYWDSEIKRAQVLGHDSFPVYTRKSHTDVSYLVCAQKMLAAGDVLYPMFAGHNAQSIAAVLEMAQAQGGAFEFQKLFGMGDGVFDLLIEQGHAASIYAPVGPHQDLLPYLVRRLLENGANTSFVNRLMDERASVDELVVDPVDKVQGRSEFKHPHIALPRSLFLHEKPMGRRNSAGVDLCAPEVVEPLLAALSESSERYEARAIVDGRSWNESVAQEIINPGDKADCVGRAFPALASDVEYAFEVAQDSFASWAGADANMRADILERIADVFEAHRVELIGLMVREAGKTIEDSHDELREAVDFCRYYAGQGRTLFSETYQDLPGPTGESNQLSLHGRGTFVCISPWNFPLAIFTGQIVAALMAGNCVLAKPAEQTPLIADFAVRLMHEAGVPAGVLGLLPGDGHVGAALVAHGDVRGVAFTGSTEVAREINRTLADKDGPIVPLIAETGGQNAMIVDSSALPEQVVDDVIKSAFGSAGQRCSALRILCVQEDSADKVIGMLKGAMAQIRVGDSILMSSDVGPVIDEEALSELIRHREALDGFGRLIYRVELDEGLENKGHYFAPCAYELEDVKGLTREVFGPILHVVRYKAGGLDELLEQINAMGYGLTLGVHSRITAFQDYVAAKVRAGNVYVNRSMTGAVVGSQPFGGMGLSGTGPKAGGPHYLRAFAHEKVISVDTTAAGGNASLVSLGE